jgi:4-hydroxy-3-polyprenylbenzoate decarboxylase
MPFDSLRDFLNRLESAGQLRRVSVPVNTHLEMTEIQTRLLAEQGPAVLFENPVDKDGKPQGMPVLVNLFGTVQRVAWGMDREPDQLRQVGETLAGATRWLARGPRDAAAAEDRHGDASENGELWSLPGCGPHRR